MKPSRASITPGGPSTPGFGQQRRLHAFASGVAGMQPLDVGAAVDKGEQPARARAGDAQRVRERCAGQPAELAGRHRRAEHRDRAGRMEAAVTQLRMHARPIAVTVS